MCIIDRNASLDIEKALFAWLRLHLDWVQDVHGLFPGEMC